MNAFRSMGRRRTLDHFGPALLEPWTRLTAPPLTRTLRQRLLDGCLSQARGRSVTDLERLRDEFLAEVVELAGRYAVDPEPGEEAAAC